MANLEQLELLRQGVEVWNPWRRDSLSSADLSEADLAGIDLSYAKLTQTKPQQRRSQ